MSCKQTATVMIAASILGLASCASLRNAGASSAEAIKNTASSTAEKISSFSFASLIPGHSGVKVVKAREKDLKELPTGKERAVAYENERKGYWILGGPVDFKEPNLPEKGPTLDGSLLPPRMP